MGHKYHIPVSHLYYKQFIIFFDYILLLFDSNIYRIIGLENPYLTKSYINKINFIAPPLSTIGPSIDYNGIDGTY